MMVDSELQEWRRRWRAQPSVPMGLFKNVECGTSYIRRYRIAESLATVFLGGGAVFWALIHPSLNSSLLAVVTCLSIAIAWVFSIRETRGIWAAVAPTTAAYLDLSIRRCRWKMRDARYDSIQSVVLAAVVLWISHGMIEDLRGTPRPLWVYAVLFVAITSVLVPLFESKRRRAKAELERLIAIRRQLEAD